LHIRDKIKIAGKKAYTEVKRAFYGNFYGVLGKKVIFFKPISWCI